MQESDPKPRRGCWLFAWGFGAGALSMLALIITALVLAPSSPSTGESASVVLLPTVTPTSEPTSTPTPLPTATLTSGEWKAKATVIPYRDLLRNVEQYIGTIVIYTGQISWVNEEGGRFEMRVETASDGQAYGDPILVICSCPVRPLKDDMVTFVGVVDKRAYYTTVLGAEVMLPQVLAHSFELLP